MTSDVAVLPDEMRDALLREIGDSETLLYAGRPDWRAELGTLVVLFLAGLCWSVLAFPFTIVSFAGLLGLKTVSSYGLVLGPGITFLIFLLSLPFSAVGVLGIAAPLLSVRKSRNTVHAVTDSRIINVAIGRDAGVDSYPLPLLTFVTRLMRRDGTGTLEIGQGIELDGSGSPLPQTLSWPGIPEAWRAEAAIREHAPNLR